MINAPTTYPVTGPYVKRELRTPLDCAREYADRGWPVFPLLPGTKDPDGEMTENGFYDATTCPHTVKRWWTDHPTANVAIRTGDASGLLVVAPDLYEEGCVWPEWEKEFGRPDTYTVRSARGGEHFYFQLPAGKHWRWRCVDKRTHIDVRANGAYVVAPKSVVGGRPYELKRGGKVAKPYDWMLDRILKPEREQRDTISQDQGDNLVSVQTPHRAVALSLPGGPRQNHQCVFELARRLRTCGLDYHEAVNQFDHWHALARAAGHLRYPYQHYRYKFDHDWPNAWPVNDAAVRAAFEKAKSEAPPEAGQFKQPEKRLLLALCWQLERTVPDWFLSIREAEKITGVHHQTVNYWLADFVTRGLLKITGESTAVKARRYRFVAQAIKV